MLGRPLASAYADAPCCSKRAVGAQGLRAHARGRASPANTSAARESCGRTDNRRRRALGGLRDGDGQGDWSAPTSCFGPLPTRPVCGSCISSSAGRPASGISNPSWACRSPRRHGTSPTCGASGSSWPAKPATGPSTPSYRPWNLFTRRSSAASPRVSAARPSWSETCGVSPTCGPAGPAVSRPRSNVVRPRP